MTTEPSRPPLLLAAAGAYTANCALGGVVGLGLVDTSGFRWLHHVLFVATATLTGLAAASLWLRRDPRLLRLLPVAVPLLAVPHVRAGTRGHVLLAAAMAPPYVAALAGPSRPGTV